MFSFSTFPKSNLFFTKRLVFTYNSATNIGKKNKVAIHIATFLRFIVRFSLIFRLLMAFFCHFYDIFLDTFVVFGEERAGVLQVGVAFRTLGSVEAVGRITGR